MFCNNCGKDLTDGVKFCPFCGAAVTAGNSDTESSAPATPHNEQAVNTTYNTSYYEAPAPEIDTPVMQQPDYENNSFSPAGYDMPVYSMNTPPKKKSKLPLILTVIIATLVLIGGSVSAFLFIPIPGTPKHLMAALRNTVNKDNFTVDVSFVYNGEEDRDTISYAIDTENVSYIAISSYERNTDEKLTQTIAYSDGNGYSMTSGNKGLPRGYTDEDAADHDDVLMYKEDAVKVFNDATKGKVTDLDELEGIDDYEDLLDELNESSGLDLSISDVEEILAVYVPLLNDKEWLEEYAGFEASKDGNARIYTFKPNTYDLLKEVIALLEDTELEDETDDLDDAIEDNKKELEKITIDIDIRVVKGLIDEIEITISEGDYTYTTTLQFRDYNNTEVDADSIKDKLEEAHEGRSTCKECDSKYVYFKGMCQSCAGEKYCENYCGKEKFKDGYCEDCFIPCAGCINRHGYEDGYCHDCYYERYCYEDCGNKITRMYDPDDDHGYCDECYSPCKNCGDRQGEDYCDGYCWSCYYDD